MMEKINYLIALKNENNNRKNNIFKFVFILISRQY